MLSSLAAGPGGMTSILGGAGFWLPRAASTTAELVDFLFNAVTWIGIFFFVLISVVLFWFVWKYRARAGHREQPSSDHNQVLEIACRHGPGAGETNGGSQPQYRHAIPNSHTDYHANPFHIGEWNNA